MRVPLPAATTVSYTHLDVYKRQDIWKEVAAQMKSPSLVDKFNDYVPPNKNMGALFLKAFKIQMQENSLM